MNRKRIVTTSNPTSYAGSQRNDSVSDSYWSDLFSGTDYEDLYKSIMLKYNTAPPNTFWGMLTGQNKTNAYNHQMSLQDELGALAEKMYNEDYQSPSSEVERMRDAGLNPDLLGLSGASASEMSPNGVPGASAQNPLNVIQGAAGVILNAFTLGKGIADGVLQFKSMKLDNLKKFMSLATDVGSFVSPQSALGDASSMFEEIDFLSSSLFRKRDARKMSHLLKSIIDTPAFKSGYYQNLKTYSDNRLGYFRNISGDHWNEDDKVMQVLSKGLSDVVNLAFKSDHERRISDNSEAIEFNDIFDSELSAEASNTENTERIESTEFKTQLSSSMRDMVSELDKYDSPLATGVKIALQILLIKYAGASL